MINQLRKWQKHKRIRRMAKKYDLDFETGCVFNHQLRLYGYPKHDEVCQIEMQSGKTALYRAEIIKICGSTGQKSWRFEFQGYMEN